MPLKFLVTISIFFNGNIGKILFSKDFACESHENNYQKYI